MKSIGIDIVSIKRIKKIYEKYGEKFLKKILSNDELNYLKGKNNIERIAGIFAAKEAVIKCFDGKIFFSDIRITYEKSGKPKCYVKEKEIFISISHEKEFSVAIAILD